MLIERPRQEIILAPDGTRLKDVIDLFKVQDPLPGKMSFGIATTKEDKCARLKIASERYIREGYITADQLDKDGVYRDRWERYAIPLVAKVLTPEGIPMVMGSLRLITKLYDLPIQDPASGIEIYPEDDYQAAVAETEWSALASIENFPKPKGSSFVDGIVRMGILIQSSLGQNYGIATVDARVLRFLNGLGLNLKKIGPTIDYMGSASTPVFIDHKDMIEGAATSKRSPYRSQFLRTGNAPGYEWYQGY